ncbi:MAG: DNA-protecting protein DprA [Spirochaetaceae bacterium]
MDKILLLQAIPGFGLVRIKKFIFDNRNFMSDTDFFYYLIKKETGNSYCSYMDEVKRIKENCFKLGMKIIPCEFSNIIDSPLLFYIKGEQNLLNSKKLLAVVGTRTPCARGCNIGKRIVTRAVKNSWIIVSGLANGCDSLAHKTTVELFGKTIAVIPMGYNENIAPWVLDNGLILSEYPPYTCIKKFRCINRNRIITGLSNGLFVIESQAGGGSEHSIKFAFKEQKPIAYGIGFKGIAKYNAINIKNIREFDQFLENV